MSEAAALWLCRLKGVSHDNHCGRSETPAWRVYAHKGLVYTVERIIQLRTPLFTPDKAICSHLLRHVISLQPHTAVQIFTSDHGAQPRSHWRPQLCRPKRRSLSFSFSLSFSSPPFSSSSFPAAARSSLALLSLSEPEPLKRGVNKNPCGLLTGASPTHPAPSSWTLESIGESRREITDPAARSHTTPTMTQAPRSTRS